jgi:hypothetical protein
VSVNYFALKAPSEDYRLRVELYEPRYFTLADMAANGTDAGAAAADTGGPAPFIEAFDGISDLGSISGSIDAGGWSCDLTIPQFPATFDDYFGVVLAIQAWHGGVWGVPGASGTALEADIFRGWMQAATAKREYGKDTATFKIESSATFLKAARFTRGMDFYAGSPSAAHGGPTDTDTIIAHLLEYHTNWTSRHPDGVGYGIYIPDHDVITFSLNEGSVYDMLKQVADNCALDGQVYCRRGDDLYIGCHPNLAPDRRGDLMTPKIDLDADLILDIEVPEVPSYSVAEVSVVAQLSDQTEYFANYYGGSGPGSRPKYTIRTDDTAQADNLAARMFAHANRRFPAVKVTLPLNVVADLGDVVALTIDIPQRGIAWSGKRFYCTAVSYQPDIQKRTWRTSLTLDEILEDLV